MSDHLHAARPVPWALHLSLLALAAAYGLWWIAPIVQLLIGLAWAGDFCRLCLIIVACSVVGRTAERFLP